MEYTNIFKIIGFNKNGTQTLLGSASSLETLLLSFAARIPLHESEGANNILPTFVKILVSENNVFTGLELPYIPTINA